MIAITCPGCGAQAWLTGEATCRRCGVVLRRCTDCTNFDVRRGACEALRLDLSNEELAQPTTLSLSALCAHYSPVRKRLAA
jgi:hypothetical protein